MTQHNPGPWDASSFQEGDLAQAYYVTNNDGRRVCLIAGYGERKRYRSPKCDAALTAEDVANARLIAAAPDLLKACRLMLDAVNEHHKDGSILWVNPGETAWELLTDAISKATGENLQKSP